MLARQHEIQRTGRSQGQAVWQCASLRGTSENHVLGGMLLYDGQEEEVATGIQRVAQMRRHRPPTTPRRGSMVEPSGVSPTYAQDNPLSPLPP